MYIYLTILKKCFNSLQNINLFHKRFFFLNNIYIYKMIKNLLNLFPKNKANFCTTSREYFFLIDHKGLLYLEETNPKNFTSCIKDTRFLK